MALWLVACLGSGLVASPVPQLPAGTPIPFPPAPATVTPILFPTHSPSVPPTRTPPPSSPSAPTLTLEPAWIRQGPDEVIVPILLYHHIGVSLQGETVYYVSPEAFDRQMNLLHQWGYRTISVELLTRAILEGAEMPPKPVILTFDDGNETTYSTALPIMQRYGFTGVAYIVHNYVGLPNYMNAEQIRALYAAGWEIGSHGISHVDLTTRPDRQKDEIVDSRRKLQSLLGAPVLSFAYPFGAYDRDSLENVHFAGYTAAMGLGKGALQASKNLFYLYRQPVQGTTDLSSFALLLPWRGDLEDLPEQTSIPQLFLIPDMERPSCAPTGTNPAPGELIG